MTRSASAWISKPPLGVRARRHGIGRGLVHLAPWRENKGLLVGDLCATQPGTITPDSGSEWTATKYGPAYTFPSGAAEVQFPHSASNSLSDSGSWMMVFQPSTVTGYQVWLMKTTSSSWNDGYGLYTVGTDLKGFVNTYSNAATFSGLSADQWYTAVVTYDRSSIRIFVNGIEGTAQSYSSAITTTTAVLGAPGGPGSFFADGNAALSAVWNRPLTTEEVRTVSGNPWVLFEAPRSIFSAAAAAFKPFWASGANTCVRT